MAHVRAGWRRQREEVGLSDHGALARGGSVTAQDAMAAGDSIIRSPGFPLDVLLIA
jgi:hypothetical protein